MIIFAVLVSLCYFDMQTIRFAAFGYIPGWVHLSECTSKARNSSKLANPSRLPANQRLNPTYKLSIRPKKWISPFDIIGNHTLAAIDFLLSRAHNPAASKKSTKNKMKEVAARQRLNSRSSKFLDIKKNAFEADNAMLRVNYHL